MSLHHARASPPHVCPRMPRSQTIFILRYAYERRDARDCTIRARVLYKPSRVHFRNFRRRFEGSWSREGCRSSWDRKKIREYPVSPLSAAARISPSFSGSRLNRLPRFDRTWHRQPAGTKVSRLTMVEQVSGSRDQIFVFASQ